MGLGKLQAFLMGVFGGAVSGQGATTGQALVKQANGSWAPGTVGGSSATVTATTAFILGSADTNGVRFDLESGSLAVREGDDSAYGSVLVNGLTASANVTAVQHLASNNGSTAAPAFRGTDGDTGIYFTPDTGSGAGLAFTIEGGQAAYFEGSFFVLEKILNVRGNSIRNVARAAIDLTSNTTLTYFDYGDMRTIANTGAFSEVQLTLDTTLSERGRCYRFVVTTAQYIRVLPGTGSGTIRDGTSVSAAGGYIRSNAVGAVLQIEAVDNSDNWYVTSKIGTWTVDS